MRSILVTGVTAAGKSTVSAQAARQMGLACYDYADLMLKAEPALSGKDAIEALPWGQRRAIYTKVTALLLEWFGPDNPGGETVLLENHLSILQDGKIVTFRTEAYRRYNARGIAVVRADPPAIFARRTGDTARNRRPGTVEEIERQQDANDEQAHIIAAHLGVPLLLLDNGGPVEAAVAAFTDWARQVPA